MTQIIITFFYILYEFLSLFISFFIPAATGAKPQPKAEAAEAEAEAEGMLLLHLCNLYCLRNASLWKREDLQGLLLKAAKKLLEAFNTVEESCLNTVSSEEMRDGDEIRRTWMAIRKVYHLLFIIIT